MENTVLFNALVHEVNASESIAKCCTESEFIQRLQYIITKIYIYRRVVDILNRLQFCIA